MLFATGGQIGSNHSPQSPGNCLEHEVPLGQAEHPGPKIDGYFWQFHNNFMYKRNKG